MIIVTVLVSLNLEFLTYDSLKYKTDKSMRIVSISMGKSIIKTYALTAIFICSCFPVTAIAVRSFKASACFVCCKFFVICSSQRECGLRTLWFCDAIIWLCLSLFSVSSSRCNRLVYDCNMIR